MSQVKSRLKNGRITTKKLKDRHNKALLAMSNAKKARVAKVLSESYSKEVVQGHRIIDLTELTKNLKCHKCAQRLDLKNIKSEKRKGLHSTLDVLCEQCNITTKVETGKIEKNVSHINASVILGTVNSGIGSTALNKILTCTDIPEISNDLYKRYEKIIGAAIEEEARRNCNRAAVEEKQLVIKNIKQLIELL
ncbi:uncharacterized protein LOC109860095 [Pseudomyrmex gracilis]|uniref:uncharacterized protein LOC109860095 n=1 Tax=Pseudomyrmex gracilis TaxID=219809 RepID=UPI0009957F6A|nr:uncharacterized protein LOC109860095 [Pseudomyrmex gracilis]